MADIERVRHTWPFPSIKPDERAPARREPRRQPASRKPAGKPAPDEAPRGRRIDEYA